MQASPLVTASHHSAPKQASGQEIRSRLLRRLGIHEDDETMVTENSSIQAQPPTSQQVLHRPAPTFFHVPLKYNNNNNTTTSDSSVGFQEHVRVVPIPMRTEYSERIRNRLWCNKNELHAMACRNLLEYEYEGWDPQTVLGDEYMIYSQTTGEHIHPVHCRSMLLQGRANWRGSFAQRKRGVTVQEDEPHQSLLQQHFTPPLSAALHQSGTQQQDSSSAH